MTTTDAEEQGYKFNSQLNLEKVLKIELPWHVSFNSLNSNHPSLPGDWLDVFREMTDSLRTNLGRHVGDTSSYTKKQQLEKSLQLIYHRINGDFSSKLPALNENELEAIKAKLNEGVANCSQGFHNRVNLIIASWQHPASLGQLLYLARKQLVTQVATTLSGEIHAWNRVSVIAHTDGLGVEANHAEDIYRGRLGDNKIRAALKKAFTAQIKPFNLPVLLCEALQTPLAVLGYHGEKPQRESYTTAEAKSIGQCINACLCSNSDSNNIHQLIADYFITSNDSNSHIKDIDWQKLKGKIFDQLNTEGYFIGNPKDDCSTLFDISSRHYFFPENNAHKLALSGKVNALFSRKFTEVAGEAFLTIKSTNPLFYNVISSIKTSTDRINYFNTVEMSTIKNSEAFKSWLILSDALLNQDETLKLNAACIKISAMTFKKCTKKSITSLSIMKSTNQKVYNKILAGQTKAAHREYLCTLDIHALKNSYVLSAWFTFFSDTLKLEGSVDWSPIKKIFAGIFARKFTKETAELLFTFKSDCPESYYETLEEAGKYTLMNFLEGPQAHNPLLMFSIENRGEQLLGFLEDVLALEGKFPATRLLKQYQMSFRNLMKRRPGDAKALCKLLEKRENLQLCVLFLADQGRIAFPQINPFWLAIYKHPDFVEPICKILGQPENVEVFKNLIADYHINGISVLGAAAMKPKKSLKPLLALLTKVGTPEMRQEAFLQLDHQSRNPLMIAAASTPDGLKQVCDYLDAFEDAATLEKILTQTNTFGSNALFVAAHEFGLENSAPLIKLLKKPENESAYKKVILQVLNRHNASRTILGSSKLLKLYLSLDLSSVGSGLKITFAKNLSRHISHLLSQNKTDYLDEINTEKYGKRVRCRALAEYILCSSTNMDKPKIISMIKANATVLLQDFDCGHLPENNDKSECILNTLLECYANEVEGRLASSIHYTTTFFFNFGYSTTQKQVALNKLKKLLSLDDHTPCSIEAINNLRDANPALRTGRLGRLVDGFYKLAHNVSVVPALSAV